MISKFIIKYSEKWIRVLEKLNLFLFKQSKNLNKDKILNKNRVLSKSFQSKKC